MFQLVLLALVGAALAHGDAALRPFVDAAMYAAVALLAFRAAVALDAVLHRIENR